MPHNERKTDRREFLFNSAGVLLLSHPAVATLARHAEPRSQPSPLKTQAQYQSEAAQFEGTFRDLAAIPTMPAATVAELSRITSVVDRAGAGIDFHDSWMVAICMADPALVAWVRKEIRDVATFNRFIDDVKRDATVVDTIPGVSALRARLSQLRASKTALTSLIIAHERQLAGIGAAGRSQAQTAQDKQCQETWSIIAAIIVIVVAVVILVFTSGASTALASQAAAELAAQYRGTGADRARRAFDLANQRYAQCVAAAGLLPAASKAKAIAACQASWLEEKAVYLG